MHSGILIVPVRHMAAVDGEQQIPKGKLAYLHMRCAVSLGSWNGLFFNGAFHVITCRDILDHHLNNISFFLLSLVHSDT